MANSPGTPRTRDHSLTSPTRDADLAAPTGPLNRGEAVERTLAELLPAGAVVTDPDILAGYRQDRALDPDAGTPLALVRPTTAEQVAAILRWAQQHRVPVV